MSFSKKTAIVVHIHYTDTVNILLRALKNPALERCSFYFTLTSSNEHLEKMIKSSFNDVKIDVFENKGRDIYPFLKVIEKYKLQFKYHAILKLHGKKTVALPGYGAFWLIDSLKKLVPQSTSDLRLMLDKLADSGVIGPAGHLFEYNQFTDKNHRHVKKILDHSSIALSAKYSNYFFGGSMLWFNREMIELLSQIRDVEKIFPVENGQRDGTIAHAIERLFTLAATNKYKTSPITVDMTQVNIRMTQKNDISVDGLIRSYEEFSNMAVVVDAAGSLYSLDYFQLKSIQEERLSEIVDPQVAAGNIEQPDNVHTLLIKAQEELARIKSSKKYKLLEKYGKIRSKVKVPLKRK